MYGIVFFNYFSFICTVCTIFHNKYIGPFSDKNGAKNRKIKKKIDRKFDKAWLVYRPIPESCTKVVFGVGQFNSASKTCLRPITVTMVTTM